MYRFDVRGLFSFTVTWRPWKNRSIDEEPSRQAIYDTVTKAAGVVSSRTWLYLLSWQWLSKEKAHWSKTSSDSLEMLLKTSTASPEWAASSHFRCKRNARILFGFSVDEQINCWQLNQQVIDEQLDQNMMYKVVHKLGTMHSYFNTSCTSHPQILLAVGYIIIVTSPWLHHHGYIMQWPGSHKHEHACIACSHVHMYHLSMLARSIQKQSSFANDQAVYEAIHSILWHADLIWHMWQSAVTNANRSRNQLVTPCNYQNH